MRKQHWILLFFLLLLADLLFVYQGRDSFHFVTKPLLVITLLLYYSREVKDFFIGLNRWIVLALVLSWLGDVLLLFEVKHANFFMAGLVAFLLAHFFYISFFTSLQRRENLKRQPMFGVLAVVWYFVLMRLIRPSVLGSLAIPIRLYGAVIMIMVFMALQMIYLKDKKTALLFVAGAVLFGISDSILALDRYYQPVFLSQVWVMLSYGMAQYFLTEGAIRVAGASTAG